MGGFVHVTEIKIFSKPFVNHKKLHRDMVKKKSLTNFRQFSNFKKSAIKYFRNFLVEFMDLYIGNLVL